MYIIAIDQGTTSSRTIVFDEHQNMLATAQKEFTQIYPQEGWVEHDPNEIWATQYGVLLEAFSKANIKAEDIKAVGITNQRETVVVWDKNTGNPVYNAIVWQCRRTAQYCDELKAKGLEAYIRENTGLVVDAYFSGTKIKWILDNVSGAREKAEKGDLLFGTIDTWLIWKLTGGEIHVTDYTNASRTMIYNIKTLDWDEKLLKELNIPRSMLPTVKSSSEIYGTFKFPSSDVKVPIAGIAGDQQAALFGQCCYEVGEAKNTYGTGCFLLMHTGEKIVTSENGLLTTIAIGINNKVEYALEGSVFVAGAAVQWLRDELQLISKAEDSGYFASKIPDTGGLYLVPAFVGLGAPYWDSYARGTLIGITRGTGREHIIRATLESIAYQTKDVLEIMQLDSGITLSELAADGGASASDFLMQFQSDILSVPVKVPKNRETTALGAAYLAGLATGVWKNREEIRLTKEYTKEYKPLIHKSKALALHQNWLRAVERSKSWVEL
ncbi:MAG: glycerol kinase GlpK [Brevinema sp.]